MSKPCILQLPMRKDGYAFVRHNGEYVLAHRVAYDKAHPDDRVFERSVVVRHTCNVRNCVEPEHLYLAPLGAPKQQPNPQEANELLGVLDKLKWGI